MHKSFLCLGGALALAATQVRAQTPAPSPKPPETPAVFENNYVLTLSPPAEKKGDPEPQVALVVTLAGFNADKDATQTETTFDVERGGSNQILFKGTFIPQKGGGYLLNYYLQAGGATATTGVLLRPGEPMQVIKNGDMFYNLRLERYGTPSAAH